MAEMGLAFGILGAAPLIGILGAAPTIPLYESPGLLVTLPFLGIAFICSRIRRYILQHEFPNLPAEHSLEWKTLRQEYGKQMSRRETMFLSRCLLASLVPLFSAAIGGILIASAVSATWIMISVLLGVISGVAFGAVISRQYLKLVDFALLQRPNYAKK